MPASDSLSPVLPSRFRLGAWIVDSAQGELIGDDERVPLNGLSLALLLALAKRAGQLSDSDSLIAEVWERVAVSDATLQQRIKLLRRALRDDSETPRYIATVRGRGYRLLLTPEPLPTRESPPTINPAKSKRFCLAVIGLLVLLSCLLALFFSSQQANLSTTLSTLLNTKRLVVLPLNMPTSAGHDALLADAVTEQLIWSLSRNPALEVIGRSSSMRYKTQQKSFTQLAPDLAQTLARELAVGSVLQGEIVEIEAANPEGKRLQITLTLSDVNTLRVLWNKRFDISSNELTSLQTQIAQLVPPALGLAPERSTGAAIDGDATSLYLRGRQHYLRYQQKDNAIAMELFRASLVRSPAYAPALAGLSDTYAQAVYQFGAPNNQLDDALRYADAAVSLAPQLAEAHKARGLALDLLGRRSEAAMSYHEASKLNPNFSDALINEAILHWESGRLADAYKLALRASSLDPLDPYAYLITAQILTSGGFAPAAQAILEQVQKHAPESAMANTIFCAHWFEIGKDTRAEQECHKLISHHHDFAAGWSLAADVALHNGQTALAIERFNTAANLGAGDDAFYARLRLALIHAQEQTQAQAQGHLQANLQQLLQQLRQKISKHNEDPDQQLQLTMVLTAVGQLDEAIKALEAAVQGGHNDRHWLQTDPLLAALRQHPRYLDVLTKLDQRLNVEHQKLQVILDKQKRFGAVTD